VAAGLVRFRIPFPSGGFNSARLVNADEGIPRLDLALDQSFESPRDLAFLIALTGPQCPCFPYKLQPGLQQVVHIEKYWMSCHGGTPLIRRERNTLSHR